MPFVSGRSTVGRLIINSVAYVPESGESTTLLSLEINCVNSAGTHYTGSADYKTLTQACPLLETIPWSLGEMVGSDITIKETNTGLDVRYAVDVTFSRPHLGYTSSHNKWECVLTLPVIPGIAGLRQPAERVFKLESKCARAASRISELTKELHAANSKLAAGPQQHATSNQRPNVGAPAAITDAT